jgi:Uma2 family endonuclease
MGTYIESHDLGIAISAPFQMKLEHGREPDLLFVASEHLSRLEEIYLDGPADLVVEIVSSESVGRDLGEKLYEHARGGVPEYWLIDLQIEWAGFYHLEKALALPGFWLRVEWMWQEPLPHPLRALGEIVGLGPEVVKQFRQALRGRR